MRPRWPHLPLGRSRQAGLDIPGQIFAVFGSVTREKLLVKGQRQHAGVRGATGYLAWRRDSWYRVHSVIRLARRGLSRGVASLLLMRPAG
jgi:hypothetical protein